MTTRTCDDCMTVLKNEEDTYGIFQPCKCVELNNTLLMWSVLTYGAGFINWWVYPNECGYCQSHANICISDEDYQNHIVDMKTIQMIVNANEEIIKQQNANGDTIFKIIDDVIDMINDSMKTDENGNKIIIGKKHISELKELRVWLGDTPLRKPTPPHDN
jgi:hypothetical protein